MFGEMIREMDEQYTFTFAELVAAYRAWGKDLLDTLEEKALDQIADSAARALLAYLDEVKRK